MPAIKLQGFGGMIPALDARLLPDDAAGDSQNVWFYNGTLQGIVEAQNVHTLVDPNTQSVFRIPIGATDFSTFNNSYWLEFPYNEISIVKTPVLEAADPAVYFASGQVPPGYNTLSRIVASQPNLVLGIPAPSVAPGVVPAGGVSATMEVRTYVYTWLSQWFEEGPPSPPTVATGRIDDTWAISVTAPSGADTTNRVLTYTNIYRTVTASTGVATYYFVAQLPIATLAYNDTLTDTRVTGQGSLQSTNYTAPPEDLKGLAVMPNGMLAGWVRDEIWFCEPYKPHAWPVQYQIAVGYDIVAMAGSGQSLLVGTSGYPYFATGVHPSAIALTRVPAAEPCVSRGSMVPTQFGAFYASPNGLIFLSAQGTVKNTTRELISKDKWQQLLELKKLRAALLNGAYFVYAGVTVAAFQNDTFQNDSFQLEDNDGTRTGALIEVEQQRVGFTRLLSERTYFNIQQDPWSGEVLCIGEADVFWMNLTELSQQEYTWLSKIFTMPYPANLGAAKIQYDPPPDGTSGVGVMKTYAWTNGAAPKLVQTKTLPASNQVFRLPTGFKPDNYQFAVEGNLQVKFIQIGSTVKDLRNV